MTDIHERVRKKIRQLRDEKGLSQVRLAFLANVHRAYVGQVERGEKKIGLTNLEKIATCRLSKRTFYCVK